MPTLSRPFPQKFQYVLVGLMWIIGPLVVRGESLPPQYPTMKTLLAAGRTIPITGKTGSSDSAAILRLVELYLENG